MLTEHPAIEWINGVIAGSLALLEGLPHPAWETKLFERELQRGDIVRIAGWPFYAEPLPVTRATSVALELLALDPASFAPKRGEGLCGGFHPDFAIVWEEERNSSYLLLCFGCSEALMLDRRVRCRVDVKVPHKFAPELEGYQRNRPERGPLR